MTLNETIEFLARIRKVTPSYNDPSIVIKVEGKSFPGTPCVGIKSIGQGIDWDNGKIIIYTEKSVEVTK